MCESHKGSDSLPPSRCLSQSRELAMLLLANSQQGAIVEMMNKCKIALKFLHCLIIVLKMFLMRLLFWNGLKFERTKIWKTRIFEKKKLFFEKYDKNWIVAGRHFTYPGHYLIWIQFEQGRALNHHNRAAANDYFSDWLINHLFRRLID